MTASNCFVPNIPEVRQRSGAALILMRLQLAVACLAGELFHLGGDLREALIARVFDDRCDQARRCGNRNRDILPRILVQSHRPGS